MLVVGDGSCFHRLLFAADRRDVDTFAVSLVREALQSKALTCRIKVLRDRQHALPVGAASSLGGSTLLVYWRTGKQRRTAVTG